MKYDIYINGSIGYPFSASFIQDELAKVEMHPARCISPPWAVPSLMRFKSVKCSWNTATSLLIFMAL